MIVLLDIVPLTPRGELHSIELDSPSTDLLDARKLQMMTLIVTDINNAAKNIVCRRFIQ